DQTGRPRVFLKVITRILITKSVFVAQGGPETASPALVPLAADPMIALIGGKVIAVRAAILDRSKSINRGEGFVERHPSGELRRHRLLMIPVLVIRIGVGGIDPVALGFPSTPTDGPLAVFDKT